jgi:undecaprenyl-diphosphatase
MPLVVFALASAALAGFVKLASAVAHGQTYSYDELLLRALRNPADPADPIGPWWVESIFRDLTSLGSTVVLAFLTLAAVLYLIIDRKRGAALFVVVAIGGGTLISTLLKNAFARPRPELVAHLVDVRSYSFPSGHAMLSAVTFLTLGALLARVQSRKRLKAYILGVAVLLTLLVGGSRIYLGVHWPSDVLAGWCLGAAWAMLCWLAASWLQKRGTMKRENDDSVLGERH